MTSYDYRYPRSFMTQLQEDELRAQLDHARGNLTRLEAEHLAMAELHERDVRGAGALNVRLYGDLRRLAAELETARADLKATRAVSARQGETLDDQGDEIVTLRKYLSDAACARDKFAVEVHKLKAELVEIKQCKVETQVLDTVVLSGWHGMTMTQDHQGTILRRTS